MQKAPFYVKMLAPNGAVYCVYGWTEDEPNDHHLPDYGQVSFSFKMREHELKCANRFSMLEITADKCSRSLVYHLVNATETSVLTQSERVSLSAYSRHYAKKIFS